MKRKTLEFSIRTAIKTVPVALVLSLGLVTASDAQSNNRMKGQTTGAAASTYATREKCVAQAQAQYPDNGLGTATVMTQRTGVYRDCMQSAGLRP